MGYVVACRCCLKRFKKFANGHSDFCPECNSAKLNGTLLPVKYQQIISTTQKAIQVSFEDGDIPEWLPRKEIGVSESSQIIGCPVWLICEKDLQRFVHTSWEEPGLVDHFDTYQRECPKCSRLDEQLKKCLDKNKYLEDAKMLREQTLHGNWRKEITRIEAEASKKWGSIVENLKRRIENLEEELSDYRDIIANLD